MGKTKSFQGKEAFQRMNFLFQASDFLVSGLNQPNLAAYYGSQMTSICKKSVLRMEPRVKRELCKGCKTLLVPGVSSRIRVKSKIKNLVVTCQQCGTLKRFPMKAGFKLWVEEPEACVQTFGPHNTDQSISISQLGTKGDPVIRQSDIKLRGNTKKDLNTAQSVAMVRTDVEVGKLQQSEGRIELTMETEKELSQCVCSMKESKALAPDQVSTENQPEKIEKSPTQNVI